MNESLEEQLGEPLCLEEGTLLLRAKQKMRGQYTGVQYCLGDYKECPYYIKTKTYGQCGNYEERYD